MAESHSPPSGKCRVEQVNQQHAPPANTHMYTLEKAASLTLTGRTKSGLASPKAPLKHWLNQVKTVRDGDPEILSAPTIIFLCIFKSWKLTSTSERLDKGPGTGGNVCRVQLE